MTWWQSSIGLLVLVVSGLGCDRRPAAVDVGARSDAAVELDARAVEAVDAGPEARDAVAAADAPRADDAGARDTGPAALDARAVDGGPGDAGLDSARGDASLVVPEGFAQPCSMGCGPNPCRTSWDGYFCYYSACTAACRSTAECVAWLDAVGVDSSSVVCASGECELGRTEVGDVVCE